MTKINIFLDTVFTTYFGTALAIWIVMAAFFIGMVILNIMEKDEWNNEL